MFQWPRVRCSGSWENSEICSLCGIHGAQGSFREGLRADADGDGVGEYGTFGELSGAVSARGGPSPPITPLLTGIFRRVAADGTVTRSRYRFRISFFARGGVPVDELPGGGFPAGIVPPDDAERWWICYAWPLVRDDAAQRTFVVTPDGSIFANDSGRYDEANPPHPAAALAGFHDDGSPLPLAHGVRAVDGCAWVQIH